MASTPVTRASLLTRINQRASTSGYVEQTVELPQLIDTSLGKLHNILAAELYEDYFQKRVLIPTVANQPRYQIPPDMMKLRAVWYTMPSSGQDPWQAARYLLKQIDTTEESSSSTTTNQPFGYTIEDWSICLSPMPGGTGPFNPLILAYIPTYTPALNDDTPIEYPIAFGWDEWVVNDVVIQIRNKAGMPAAELMAERASFEKQLRVQAKNRNALEPPRVRDTGWRYGGSAPPWGQFSFRS
jgi:hypothetical protein